VFRGRVWYNVGVAEEVLGRLDGCKGSIVRPPKQVGGNFPRSWSKGQRAG